MSTRHNTYVHIANILDVRTTLNCIKINIKEEYHGPQFSSYSLNLATNRTKPLLRILSKKTTSTSIKYLNNIIHYECIHHSQFPLILEWLLLCIICVSGRAYVQYLLSGAHLKLEKKKIEKCFVIYINCVSVYNFQFIYTDLVLCCCCYCD